MHSFLDVISLQTLAVVTSKYEANVQSREKHINSLNSTDIPLVHLSLRMDPNAIAIVQLLQCTVPQTLTRKRKAEFASRSDIPSHSLGNLSASRVQGNVLIYHDRSRIPTSEENYSAERNQTIIKVSCSVFLPVLQTGLFTWLNHNQQDSSFMKQSRASTSPSVLNFHLENPSYNCDTLNSKNIIEASVNGACISVTARILQSEVDTDPVLSWDSIDVLQNTFKDLISSDDVERSEVSKNSVMFNVKVSSSNYIELY